MSQIDYKNPDYVPVFLERQRRLAWIRANPAQLPALKLYYRDHIAAFIDDFAMTLDPRVSGAGRSPLMPFKLFPKQIELVDFIVRKWRAGEPGVLVKSRDVGASWLAFAAACSLCIFHKDMAIGFGSALEVKLDRSGDPDTLFHKGRTFMKLLPVEFRAGWDAKLHAPHMRMTFPETGSSITGEAGDNIGRGGRKAIFFVDEAAHVERPLLIDASLSANTDCRIDMSSVYGTNNPFAQKALGGVVERFDFHWKDDPRKDDAWAARKRAELDNDAIWEQEYNCNFSASVEGTVIPSAWIEAALDAHVKLGITPTGIRIAGMDVADVGRDKCALAGRHGILLSHATQWTGKNSDLYESTEKAFALCDEWGFSQFEYDADGMGAAIRGDARKVSEARKDNGRPPIDVRPYRGSEEVLFPEQKVPGYPDRKNVDYFRNRKAQNWFHARWRFRETWRAINGAKDVDLDNIISISSAIPQFRRIMSELAQPTYKQNANGKMEIEKMPDGALSPNYGDAVVIAFAVRRLPMAITDAALAAAGAR